MVATVSDNFASDFSEVVQQHDFRTNHEWPAFARVVGQMSGEKLLDLACGSGYYTRKLQGLGAGTVIGVDISRHMLEEARTIEQEVALGIEYIEGIAEITSIHD